MPLNTFEDLFDQLLVEAFLLEEKGIDFFPKMIDLAYSDELKKALDDHFFETKKHSSNIEEILKKENIQYEKEGKCSIDIIIEKATNLTKEKEPSSLLDAAIIAYVQQIEHVEIALYGTLKEYAKQLKDSKITSSIKNILKDEVKIDTIFTKLSTGGFFNKGINKKATE